MKVTPSLRMRIAALVGAIAVVGAVVVGVPQAATAGPSTVTTTFSYTGSTSSFTVPAGITAITITVTGAQGGNGGADATPAPPNGGYQGVVTGVISVTPGQVLTIGVGSGGATGASGVNSSSGNATAGSNPISGYGGGRGGAAGARGSSGAGGAGGAASVVQIAGNSVVAAGGGGNGGSGQYPSTRGHVATSTFFGRTDTVTGVGQTGINANDACLASSCSNNDGGGSGGGGGGALGGGQGPIEFGAGSSNEWFGYGGSVGQNSTASFAGLSAAYQYYSTNGGAGSVSISYTTGSPAAPSAVTGTASNGSVNLAWTAPTDPGQSAIGDYVVQYSSNNGTSWSAPFDMSTTDTTGTVTGLVNGTAYLFQVAAVNSVGTGVWSPSSAPITPLGPPAAPTILLVTAQDGALGLALSAPSSGAPATGYDYRLNGGSWVAVPSTSTTIVIPGLINGTSYTVEVRAESAVGSGDVSAPASGTPLAVPGAPTISSLSVGNNSLGVSFTPGFSGGGTITSYQYRLNGGSWVTATGTTSPISIAGLTAGTSYSVAVRAVNAVGAGAASAPASASTPSAPGAPTVSSVVAGDGSVTVSFSPGSTGGSPITGYQYQLTSGGQWFAASSSSSPLVLTGLSNGTNYAVSVRAVNAVDNGAASAPIAATPATTPGAPSIVGNTVASGNGTLSAAFTAPSSDGGSAIIGYQYSTDAGATWRDRTDGASTDSPVVISTLSSDGASPLVAGTTYYVELRAVNGVGAGTASAVAHGIATTAPTAPVISTVTAAPQSLAVTFTAGANGGSAITSYDYSTDGGSTWTDTGTLGTSFVIIGLTNGQSYPVRVRALNGVGTGAASAAVNGRPVALPGQPVISGVVRSNQTLTTSVTLADNGGSVVTSWQYSTDAGATWAAAPGATSPLTLTRLSSNTATLLANGTGYAVQVRAVTAVGTGPASATTIVAPAAAPSAPSIALTPGDGSVSVAFTLGTDGGSPVTQLEDSLDGGTTWSSTGTLSSPFTISGLANGTAYGVLLRADNAIGSGTPSVSASTTPRTVPDAPTAVVAVSNTASADLSWTAPSFNGGSVITGYTVAAYATSTSTTPISTCTTSGATLCTVTGLTNGTAYYLAVTATNAAGTGSASAPRVLVTPLARPSAPTLNSLTAGDGTLSVAFTAGAAGDRAIASYQYSIDGGTTWQAASGTTSPILLIGLTNGTSYTIALRAVSAAGVGASSNTLSATPYTYPSAPDATTIVANGGNGQVTVSWAAANLNGGTLLNYTATAFSALTGGSTINTCTTTTLNCAITGLSNGTTYYISLQTQNSANMFSPRSAPRVAATPSLQPGAPTAVVASAGDASATVSWTAPTSTGASSISGYKVYCSADGGSYTLCATVSSPTPTSTTVSSLTNGSSYTFRVYAVNGNGTGPASATSTAVTPLGTGVAPTFGPVTRTATGFTTTISNYDGSTSYSGLGSNGATVAVSGQNVTVTNLANGTSSHVTITAAKSAQTDASSSVDGAALLTGATPAFSGNLANGSGFTFTLTNYDPSASYSLSVTSGTVTRTGSAVQVTGLLLGGTATVHVTVSKAGSTNASADDPGAAMVVGTAPTFANLVSTDTGFQVDIANYNSALSYTFSLPAGVSATRSGSTITVTGLSDGASADLTVIATDPTVSQASAVQNGTALLSSASPAVSTVTPTTDGFGFTITNQDLSVTYTVTTSAGVSSLVDGVVTVTGLNPGQNATVTLTATETGYVTTQTLVTAAALLVGITPLFTAPTPTADGFTFLISNFDSAGTYLLSSSAGTAVRAGSTVTVTGLAANGDSTVTVTVSHGGYTDAIATQSGTALAVGIAPVFGSVVPTADGFTFAITNYNPALDYSTALVPSGLIVLNFDGTGTVSGEAAGSAVTLTVTATDPGTSTASGATTATVLVPGVAPILSASTPLAGGYTFTITNYDSSQSYSFVQSAGGTVVRSGSTVTISGLAAGVSSDTQVTAAQAGSLSASATAGGTSFPSGNAPAVSAITRTLDGFTFQLTLDPSSTYAVSSDAGTVTLSGTTVTVTGLGAGATTTVHITASAQGVLDEVSDVAGSAINAGVAPTFSSPVSATGGFVVTITNYSSAFGYVLSTSAGTVTRNGANVTVAGLAAGASATLRVVATQNGYRDASGSVTGHATSAPPSPAAPSVPAVPTPNDPTVTSTPVTTEQTAPGGPSDASSVKALHESKAGGGTVTSGGATVTSQLAITRNTASVSTVAGLKLTVAAQRDGATIALAADGVVEVDRSGQLWVTVAGLAPQSLVTMWSRSDTLELGAAHTDVSGWTGTRILLPRELTRGVHTLVVTGVSADGTPVTMQIGFRVLDAQATAAVTPASSGSWAVWVIAALILLVLGIWFLIWRRRRRDQEDEELPLS